MHAPALECFSPDPFVLLWSGFIQPEVDIGACDVIQALVVVRRLFLQIQTGRRTFDLQSSFGVSEDVGRCSAIAHGAKNNGDAELLRKLNRH